MNELHRKEPNARLKERYDMLVTEHKDMVADFLANVVTKLKSMNQIPMNDAEIEKVIDATLGAWLSKWRVRNGADGFNPMFDIAIGRAEGKVSITPVNMEAYVFVMSINGIVNG